jgi:ABC-2 type transport system ATP-binding protein
MYEITVQNVTKRYNDKLALDNVSTRIEEGEIFGLLGPNGAGKTTLIHLICGLIGMDSGEIHVGSHSIKKHAEKIKAIIGYVPQDIVLFDSLSVADNLEYFGRLYHLSGSALKSKMEEAMEITGLAEHKKQKVKKMSGGMKRRLNIACAIMHDPKILVLDEPTVGVDPQSRNHILESVKEMNKKRGMTVLYTSHYMEEAEAICDRLMILDLGKELVQGTKKEIIRSITNETAIEVLTEHLPAKVSVMLQEIVGVKKTAVAEEKIRLIVDPEDSVVERVVHLLLNENVKIRNISIDNPTLETVFLSITGKELRD